MDVPVNCLVIGIDYGTTYTGVAFRDLSFAEHGRVIDSDIHPIVSWPGVLSRHGDNKVPSQISYAAGDAGQRQWGYDIAPKTLRLGLTKLELEDQDRLHELQKVLEAVKGMETLDISIVDQSNGTALAYTKDAEAVVADYLMRVREYLVEYLREIYSAAYLELTPIDLVVTVPAGWSEKAKDRTLRAFKKAGFDNSNPDFARLRGTHLMSEPEAAALAVVCDRGTVENTFRPGDCFVVCDAGGGTVDLISYRIKETQPALVLEEVGCATGGRCGASYIDAAFQQWLQTKIGPVNYAKLLKHSPENAIGSHTTITQDMQELMDSFEAVKRTYKGAQSDNSITLPRVLHDMDGKREMGIRDDEIKLTKRELSSFFDPNVERVLELIANQYAQVRHADMNVKHIFLSGGFGESKYLQMKIEEFARLRRVKLQMAADPWLSVVTGAVLKGLENGRQVQFSNICRRHYGIATSQVFSSFRHAEGDAYNDPFDGEKKATKQMTWLIRKGDMISPGGSKVGSTEICKKFGVSERRVFRTTVVAYDDDDAPQRQADIHNGGATSFDIVYDLSRVPVGNFTRFSSGARGLPYFSAKLRVEFRLGNDFQVQVTLNGEEIVSVTKPYV